MVICEVTAANAEVQFNSQSTVSLTVPVSWAAKVWREVQVCSTESHETQSTNHATTSHGEKAAA